MISIVINCDSRPGSDESVTEQTQMAKGTRSFDFLWDGVVNKMKFFEGYDFEVILFVDRHLQIPNEIIQKWNTIENLTVCLSQHRSYFDDLNFFPKWNDINYLQALYLARGKYICHFDQDIAVFKSPNFDAVGMMLNLLDLYTFVSYPSHFSPAPDCGSDWEYWWASTRFFVCERRSIDFAEIEICLRNSDYLYSKYGDKKRRCPWLEHILGIIAGRDKVYYPNMDLTNYMIFSWQQYKKGDLEKLMTMNYDDVRRLIEANGGISYPCDAHI